MLNYWLETIVLWQDKAKKKVENGGLFMFCSKCGNQMADDSLFCPKCGNKVGGATTASAPVEEKVVFKSKKDFI